MNEHELPDVQSCCQTSFVNGADAGSVVATVSLHGQTAPHWQSPSEKTQGLAWAWTSGGSSDSAMRLIREIPATIRIEFSRSLFIG